MNRPTKWLVIAASAFAVGCNGERMTEPDLRNHAAPSAHETITVEEAELQPAEMYFGDAYAVPCPPVANRMDVIWDGHAWTAGQLRNAWSRGSRSGYRAMTTTSITLTGLNGARATATEIVVTCRAYRTILGFTIVMYEDWEVIGFQRVSSGGDDNDGGTCDGSDNEEEEWEMLRASTHGVQGSAHAIRASRGEFPLTSHSRLLLANACDGGGDDSPGGGDDDGGGGDLECWEEYIIIEVSVDGGDTWHTWWEGWGTVCDLAE
jgi:hypothetical protein